MGCLADRTKEAICFIQTAGNPSRVEGGVRYSDQPSGCDQAGDGGWGVQCGCVYLKGVTSLTLTFKSTLGSFSSMHLECMKSLIADFDLHFELRRVIFQREFTT